MRYEGLYDKGQGQGLGQGQDNADLARRGRDMDDAQAST